jgi:PKD repeat protein
MPVAAFILSSASPLVDQTVTLDASRSHDLDGSIVSYKWTFGDGATTSKTVPTTTHVYTEDGTYTIRLTVTDNSGKTDTGTKIITVRRTTSSLSILTSPNPTTTKEGTQIKGALGTGKPSMDIRIYYRETGSETWNTLATTRTDPDGYYSFRWFPTQAGDYELKADWLGDSTSLPAQTPVVTLDCEHIQTLLTIRTGSSSTTFGLNMTISGTLANMYGDALEDENIVLSYKFRGVQDWIPITSDRTDVGGNFSVTWIPTVTGYYVFKAEWSGNSSHSATSSTATLSSISYKNQILSVESNSSTSQLSYNESSRFLSFLVTGPTDSRGYARITVAKALIGNSSRVGVHLDGVEKSFSMLAGDGSWVLLFDYSHSVHQVVVYLDVAPIPEMPLFMFLPLFMLLSGAFTVLARKRFSSLRGT